MVVLLFSLCGLFWRRNFDSSYEDVNKTYGKFDENRAHKTDTKLFLFKQEKKDGMIRIFGRIKSDVLWGQSGLIHSF
jgi:hypothetical protein